METNENEDTTVQNVWDTAKAVLEGNTLQYKHPSKKLKKTSNTQANLAPKGTGERTENKTYIQQK